MPTITTENLLKGEIRSSWISLDNMSTIRLYIHLLLTVIICYSCPSGKAQAKPNASDITAYGNQTKKYMSAMHYIGVAVATKAVALSNNPTLMAQTKWRHDVLSELSSLSVASEKIQAIRPVPRGLQKLNRDFASLGRQMDLAASTYKRGVETSNNNLVYQAFNSMKEVDNILVGLSAMRNK